MRGEDRHRYGPDPNGRGSPPHARGRRGAATAFGMSARITPACAGKTVTLILLRQSLPDHPRMRGEDILDVERECPFNGSPPHARGRRIHRLNNTIRRRITPACAGKTIVPLRHGIENADHPRMRGEDSSAETKEAGEPGSPPHARGRQTTAGSPTTDKRITPACAGKTQ